MKDYLNFEGLTHFFNKLLSKFIIKDELVSITDSEIDEICGTTLEFENELVDTTTNTVYTLYVDNGNLSMRKVE